METKYGFNFLWMFVWHEGEEAPAPDLEALDFLAEYNLRFVRIPTDYRHWTRDFNYREMDESVLEKIDGYLDACRQRGLHLNLNMHRAPGYCVNRWDLEKHRLWTDPEAQEGFAYQWAEFARRYKGVPNTDLSFDLVNEPGRNEETGMTRENHAAVIRRTIEAIHEVDPQREIVIDGVGCGNQAIPELADAGAIHSGRGYTPFQLSHYRAGWVSSDPDSMPEPAWPDFKVGDRVWNREALVEFYRPWREVEARGTPVMIGEFGCYDKTPNDVALAWFEDLFSIYKEYGWSYCMWNFKGPFGVIEHGRPGTRYERIGPYHVDRALFDLYLNGRVDA